MYDLKKLQKFLWIYILYFSNYTNRNIYNNYSKLNGQYFLMNYQRTVDILQDLNLKKVKFNKNKIFTIYFFFFENAIILF